MADIDFSVAPYHDRFDPSQNRNKVLFRPDRPLQQAELNELQSIIEYNLRRLGDSVFEDGTMFTGMSFSIDRENNTITVEDGVLYLSGKVRQFKEQSIQFSGQGTEKIGVKVVQRVIDHNEDPSLLDPTQGVDSYLSEGADRLEETVVLTYNDESTPTIYEFEDGDLFLEPERPEFSFLNDILATRTHEESGSYQVEGFEMYSEPHPEDDNLLNLVIEPGIAYVLGYRIHKPTPTRIPVRKSLETREVLRETHTYDTSVRRNRIGSDYVKDVIRVFARTESPAGLTITKGTEGGRDPLPPQYTGIIRDTVQIWTDSPARTYTYGTDFTIVEESGVSYVNWDASMNGQEPAQGTTYRISFLYDRLMVEGADYKVVKEYRPLPGSEYNAPGWATYIDFNGMVGIKPIDGGLISVDYSYYLAREDIVTLNSLGTFAIVEGQPDRASQAVAPEHTDPNTLKIGNVFVYPNTHITEARNSGIKNLRMDELQNLKKRLENVEYNQVIQAMERAATVTDDPMALRGVFADGFVDVSRMDLQLSNVALSFEDASITIPTEAPPEQMRRPEFLENESTAKLWGRIVTAPFTEVREIYQPLASEAMNINPYAVYNKLGVLKLTPSSDNWIEEEIKTTHDYDRMEVRLDRWWAHGRTTTKHSDLQWVVDRIELDSGQQWEGKSWRYDVEHGRTGTITDVSRTLRGTEVIEFMRQIDVEIHAENLQPNANNLYLTFDGQQVPVEPLSEQYRGSSTGTLRADASGKTKGKFTIPAGVRTGTREVVLQNDTNMAITTFTARGTRRLVEERITTTFVTVNLYDPLAQSFVFNQDRVVTSFDLYFASKSNTDNVIVQVRGMSEGGFPNQTVYAERVLTPSEIKISNDASVPTRVHLDDPLMCRAGEDYCLVLITDSNEYTMWIATLGQRLINNPNEVVGTQPYVNGVLFSSSNARTWTVHQTSDLKFGVYTARFADEGIVEFDTMEDLDSDMMLLMATYLTPENTGCVWEVRAVDKEDVGTISIDNVPWQPLVNFVEVETRPEVIGLVKLRARFKTNRYISPMMTIDDLLFVNFVSQTAADYVTLNIDSEEAPFNNLRISYDAHLPGGATVTPYYSLDGGTTWQKFNVEPVTSRVSAEYTRYTFEKRVSNDPTNTQVRFKLELRAENRFARPRVRRFTAVFKDVI